MWFNHPIEEYGPLRGKYSRSGNEIHGIPTVLIRNFCVFKEQLSTNVCFLLCKEVVWNPKSI